MDMVSSLYHDNLQQIVSSGQATQAELDEAMRHVLRVEFALGLFEHPFVDESAAPKALYHPDSIALAQTAAERSFVLLKNANGSRKRKAAASHPNRSSEHRSHWTARRRLLPIPLARGRSRSARFVASGTGAASGRRPRVSLQGMQEISTAPTMRLRPPWLEPRKPMW